MSKWLYNFSIVKKEEVTKEEKSKNENGEEITTKKRKLPKEKPL